MLVSSQNHIGDGNGFQYVIHYSAVAVVFSLQRVQAAVDAGVFIPEPGEDNQRNDSQPPAPMRFKQPKESDKRHHDSTASDRL
ncbi:hypothetical protein MX851_003459 [Citrobacter freundii]